MKQKMTELKRDINNSTITVGEFNTSFSMMDRTTGQKINKERDLNSTLSQLDLTDIYRTLSKPNNNKIKLFHCT